MYRGSCLHDIVGIRQLCTPDVNNLARLWLNDLPGVEAADFEKITDSDDATGQAVWEKVQREGINSFYSLVEGKLNNVKSRTQIFAGNTGEWAQPLTAQATADNWRGFKFDLRGSEHLELRLFNCQIYAGDAPTDVNLNVYDLETGAILETIAGPTSATGFISFDINKSYFGRRIFVAYDASLIVSRKMNTYPQSWFDSKCSCNGCSLLGFSCRDAAKALPITESNSLSGECAGMILNFAIGCGLENWLCQHINGLAAPLMYHLGEAFFTHRIASRRLNDATMGRAEYWEKLINYCADKFKETFDPYMMGVNVNDSICFECKSPVQIRSISL